MHSSTRPTGLLLNLQERAAGVSRDAARFSWIVPMLGDARQRSSRLQIAASPSFDPPVWDSGTVASAESTGVLVEGLPLEPSTPYWWRVQVSTTVCGEWSVPAAFTSAPEHWAAAPIWADDGAPWALLRTEIDLPDAPIRAALLEVLGLSPEGGPGGSAGPHGGRQHVVKVWVNGQVTGFASVRSPDHRPRLHTYDVTAPLRSGPNALAALAWAQEGQQFAARLVVILEDGTRLEHATAPGTWRARSGEGLLPGRRSIGGGWYFAPAEDRDLREEPVGWTRPGYDDSGWVPATAAPPLPGPPAAAIVNLEQVRGEPARLVPGGAGTWSFDLGREVVGGLRVECLASSGARVEVHLGEQLDAAGQVISSMPTGNVYEETWTLREGRQAVEHWGYRAFRYGELSLLDGQVEDLQVTPVILRSAPRHTGRFTTSDPDLDRVHELCRYSIEATSLDLYLDTPARERGPYEGDAFVNQLSQYACERSYALARTSTEFLTRRPTWPAEYHLMPVLVAWEDYLATGDDAQLRSDLDLWRRATYDRNVQADGLVHKDPGPSSSWDADLVDWPQTCRDDFEFTPVNTVLNAFQVAAHETLARICTVLGRRGEADHHAALADRGREGIEAQLVREDGTFRDGIGTEHASQHANAIPVALGLAPTERQDAIGDFLAAGGMRMSVYGAQFLLDALFTLGRAEEAHALMTSRGERSWLHLIDDLGASIVPEAWDPSLKPNMTYSHAWGTAPVNVIARWVLGVRVVAPGAARLEIAPQPGPLTHMEGTVPTIRGDVHVRYDQGAGVLEVLIPANATARVRCGSVEREIGPGISTIRV
ncbi:family 78 glycoside hydrolase catalytic domain [Brachybacterium sp. FME24]|uniref:family 78 glycoside hydrolase catalytic domain n=1 Tax=Brachybacterium sp. FME24 TaxID=2742605 RepID=UPI0018675D69|nr:family 78 glycoside hydrolase catalytic domain [Brachybacterium sp. FME24]